MSAESKKLSSRGELLALLKKKFPGDDRERTYLQLLIEGQAKAAIKGNVEAAKLLLRYAHLSDNKARWRQKKDLGSKIFSVVATHPQMETKINDPN